MSDFEDALRYRYLRDHCSDHHPMTQEQPAEWSIQWEFQQHTPAERFGTFDALIDADIAKLDLDDWHALRGEDIEGDRDLYPKPDPVSSLRDALNGILAAYATGRPISDAVAQRAADALAETQATGAS